MGAVSSSPAGTAPLLFDSWSDGGATLFHVIGAARAFLADFSTGHGFIPCETVDDTGQPWRPEAARLRKALEAVADFDGRLRIGSREGIAQGELQRKICELGDSFAELGRIVFTAALAAAPKLEFACGELAAGRAERLDCGDIRAIA